MKYYEVPKSHNLQILRIIHFYVYQAKKLINSSEILEISPLS